MVITRVNLPATYHNRRNLALAWNDGYRAGTIATSPLAVPLRVYVRESSQQAYEEGFRAAQRDKRAGATA